MGSAVAEVPKSGENHGEMETDVPWDTNEVPEWANTKGTFTMAGDSCHAMLPYLAQGANSSLEDGAVLGYLLGKVSQGSKERQLPRVAQSYLDPRKGRVEMIQSEALGQRGDFHLEDGPE